MNKIYHSPYERPCIDCLDIVQEAMFLQGSDLSLEDPNDYSQESGNSEGFQNWGS